jgi:hypothetical protein
MAGCIFQLKMGDHFQVNLKILRKQLVTPDKLWSWAEA